MALKFMLDSLDGVGDDAKALYVEKDGKYILDLEGADEFTSAKSALENSRKTERMLKQQVAKWEKLGKSPDEIAELTAKAEQAEEQSLTKAGDWEKLRLQMVEKQTAEIKTLNEKYSALEARHREKTITAEATARIAEAKGNVKLLLPIIEKFVRLDDEGHTVIVVDEKGDRRINAQGRDLTIAELVTELKSSDDYGQAFISNAQGSGKNPSLSGTAGSSGNGQIPKSFAAATSLQEEVAFIATKLRSKGT